jgi:DNA-binding NarL/FixJ family response regulator
VIRVAIADDHGVVRDGLRAALSERSDIEIIGDAATGNEAVALVNATRPDVLVLDLHLPDIDGATVCRRVAADAPDTRVLILTMHGDDDSVLRALRAGARGYLLKDAGRDEIEAAIRTVAGGGTILGAIVGDRLLDAISGASRQTMTPFPQLTDKERETLELVAQGRSNPDIARMLFLSEKTVRNRVSAIFSKIGAADRAGAIIAARDAGFGRG